MCMPQAGARARCLHVESHSSRPADRSATIVAPTRSVAGAAVSMWFGPAGANQVTLGPGAAVHGVARDLSSHGISERTSVSTP